MAEQPFNPSKAILINARILPYSASSQVYNWIDILPMVTGVNLSQSIDQNAFRGSLRIHDRIGLLEGALASSTGTRDLEPLRGEERLDLTIKCFDNGTEVSLALQIYKIDSISPTNNLDGKEFVIHFISAISFEALKRRVIEPFTDKKGSEIVKNMFEKYFSKVGSASTYQPDLFETLPFDAQKYGLSGDKLRNLYIQPTEGLLRVIIPNLTSTGAMNFISRKSYSKKSPSCMFRFFETVEGYYFVTDEWLTERGNKNKDRIIELDYNPFGTMDPRDPEVQIKTIEQFDNPVRVDTASDLVSGGYVNELMEIDIVNRDFKSYFFDYINTPTFYDMGGGQKTSQRVSESDVHTKDFILDTFTKENARKFMVVRDFKSQGNTLRGDQHFTEIVTRRIAYSHHINRTPVNIKVKGRLDIVPGKIINVNIPSLAGMNAKSRNVHEQLAGKYLVYATEHNISNDILETNIKLLKFDWS